MYKKFDTHPWGALDDRFIIWVRAVKRGTLIASWVIKNNIKEWEWFTANGIRGIESTKELAMFKADITIGCLDGKQT